MGSFERQIKELLAEQKQTWQVARENYAALGKVQTRTFNYLGRELLVQFNPERIRSSAAKVDKTSLQARPCFFCHRPKEQKSVIYNEDFEVLVNPYPIFQEHLTIPLRHHERQQILPYFHTLLELAVVLPSFVLFYNGPKCGASAPDHMHFRAGNNLGFPLFKDWCGINKTQVWEEKNTRLYTSVEALPRMFFIVSKKKEEAIFLFERLYKLMEVKAEEYEPMMNVIVWMEKDSWVVGIFPRKALRPSCYYAEGEANLLVSPATVEMSGLFVLPLEKDFKKVTLADLQTIWQEVSITEEEQVKIIHKLKNT